MPKTLSITHKGTGQKIKINWDAPKMPTREQIDQIFADRAAQDRQKVGPARPPGMNDPERSTGRPAGLGEVLGDALKYSSAAIPGVGGLFGAAGIMDSLPNSPTNLMQPGMTAAMMPVGPPSARPVGMSQQIESPQALNAPVRPPSGLMPQRSVRLDKLGQPESLTMQSVDQILPESGNRIDPSTVAAYKVNPPGLEDAPILRSDNTIFDGHHRVAAAAERGLSEIPTWKPSELAQSFVPKHYEKTLRTILEGGDLSHLPELLSHAKDYAPSQLENDLRGIGLPSDQVLSALHEVHGPDLVQKELDFAGQGKSPLVRP